MLLSVAAAKQIIRFGLFWAATTFHLSISPVLLNFPSAIFFFFSNFQLPPLILHRYCIMNPLVAKDAQGVCLKDSFQILVTNLSQILGLSSGLTSEDVDVQELHECMEAYISNEKEWSKYAFSDSSRGYTRNLVDEGNGKSNLVGLLVSKYWPIMCVPS